MSALPPKADIETRSRDVRFVPKADILRCGKKRRYSITSSARASNEQGMPRPSAFPFSRFVFKVVQQRERGEYMRGS